MANGAGFSISHIGHSRLTGSSLKLCNILLVPRINHRLLSVYRLLCDNDVFVGFHRRFFLVKDKSMLRLELALDFPEEERMIQQSSVSISLSF